MIVNAINHNIRSLFIAYGKATKARLSNLFRLISSCWEEHVILPRNRHLRLYSL